MFSVEPRECSGCFRLELVMTAQEQLLAQLGLFCFSERMPLIYIKKSYCGKWQQIPTGASQPQQKAANNAVCAS